MTATGERLLVFAGSYAEETGDGVYVYELIEETGELRLLNAYGGLKNPTFLNVDPDNRKLYAIAEGTGEDGAKTGQAVSFAIDPAAGALTLLNKAPTVPAPTCHIQRDSASRYLLTVSYHGGLVGLNSIAEDGTVGEALDIKRHTGGLGPAPQDRPHPHSAFLSPDEKFVLVPDLGLDCIFVYSFDRESEKLVTHGEATVDNGSGPRHLVFRPDGKFVYVINELNSTITVFRYDAAEGRLERVETVPTLPEDYSGVNACAEIAVSPDGRYIYGSNRGHDSIVVLASDPSTGRLSLVQHIGSGGGHPRHFALTPKGDYLLSANRDSNNIVTYRVHPDSGRLEPTGYSVTVSKPVCVRPVYM